MSGTLRSRWRREVFRSKRVQASTKVVLLLLADHMREDGRVSVPRAELARQLDVDERRITEHVGIARKAGLLDQVRAGKPGYTAEYTATLPGTSRDRVKAPSSRPLSRLVKGADDRTTEPPKGADDRMVRLLAPIGVRTTAPPPPAHKGADDQPAKTTPDPPPDERPTPRPAQPRKDQDQHWPPVRAIGGQP